MYSSHKKMGKKEILTSALLVIIVIGTIILINYIRATDSVVQNDEETIKCIAKNSTLVVSKTCGHCANQKQILGKYIDLFTLYEASESPEILQKYSITGVPTWIINEKAYTGVKTIEELKELTGC